MTNALTPASILAASLALVPVTASAGDASSERRVDYITIVDSSDIGAYLADEIRLGDYEGPVVVARTAESRDFPRGYIMNLSFSSEAMGPMEGHPIFELVDPETLNGAPMFLTDSLNPKDLVIANRLPFREGDMAGILDMNYAADDVYEEFRAGIGEGDYLAVTHEKAPEGLNAQAVFRAHVFDPSSISSLMIAEESGVSLGDDMALALVLSAEREELAAGFEERVKIFWVANGPDSANDSDIERSDDADSVADDGTSSEGSSPKLMMDGTREKANSVSAATDLPDFPAALKAPASSGARFAPVIERAPTLR